MDIDLKQLLNFSKNLLILYVEDNKEARDSTYDMLKVFFDEITTAVDGHEGLIKFKEKNFDLVITDINMPNMNGIDMITHIRNLNHDIPIFITSAYNESDYFIQTIKLGVEGYLLKPIQLDQLLLVLSKVIEKLKMKKELQEYQKSLESKVQEQLQQIKHQNDIIKNREKFAVMGEMIDAITHQFKQPLGIMRLRTDEIEFLLRKGNYNVSESLESINRQIEFSVNTIEEFRNFFRPNTQKKKLSIKKIFETVLLLIKDELIKSHIEIKIEVDPSLTVEVHISEFKHVILNLINNAKDALVEKNIIKGSIFLNAYKIDETTYICVEDNGEGIPKDIIEKIFEPNFTTKQDKKGTGIGLHISKMILEKIGASIKAENGKYGAKFTIAL